MRSDLPLDAYVLHPDEVAAVVSVPLEERSGAVRGASGTLLPGQSSSGARVCPRRVDVTVAGFAAGAVGGYAARALQGLLEVVGGGSPQPFELR